MNDKMKKWLSTRPVVIRKLAKKYPPGEYMIKSGAPYGISCTGTKVCLYSYHENGNVSVVVMAENKTKEALLHEKMLCEKYNKNEKKIHLQNVQVEIDPVWMELVKPAK